MPRVFFSYARADAGMVDRIAAHLKVDRVDVWLDRDQLTPGQSWVEQIEHAISRTEFLVFFISKTSLWSKWALAEFEAAFASRAQLANRIIPVLLEEIDADFSRVLERDLKIRFKYEIDNPHE